MTNIKDNYLLFKKIPISYIGGKKKLFLKIAPFLINIFDEADIILDGFSGSGIISAFLSQYCKQIYSNDILYSSYALTTTISQNPGEILNDEEKEYLSSHRCIDGILFENEKEIKFHSIIKEKYPDILTKNEAMWISYMLEKSKDLSPYKKLIADCIARGISTIIPFNSAIGSKKFLNRIIQKEKYQNRCLGYYYNSSYEIDCNKWFNKYADTFNDAVIELSKLRISDAICFNDDIFDILESDILNEITAAYFDAPYGYVRAISYADRYKFQENLLGVYSDNKSLFQNDDYLDTFNKLVQKTSFINKVVFSYDSKSWASVKTIKNILEKNNRNVEVICVNHVHGMNGVKQAKNNVCEYLIVATK